MVVKTLRAMALATMFATLPLGVSAAQPALRPALVARLQHHPLYGMLLQLDRQIAALQATLDMPGFAAFAASATADAREAGRDLAAGAARERDAAASRSVDTRTEQDALALLARGGDAGGPQAYRVALGRAQSNAMTAYSSALNARVERAYVRRAAQFSEAESALTYRLEQRDAGQVLPLRVRLTDLDPDPATRGELTRRLTAIFKLESDEVESLHAKDQATLAAYRSSLVSAAQDDFRRESVRVARDTSTNMRARLAVASPAPRAAPVSWHAYDAADANQLQDAAARLEAARTPIALHSQNAVAIEAVSTQATLAQIASLRNERRTLYEEILADVERQTDSR
jgi:hypothetical protein